MPSGKSGSKFTVSVPPASTSTCFFSPAMCPLPRADARISYRPAARLSMRYFPSWAMYTVGPPQSSDRSSVCVGMCSNGYCLSGVCGGKAQRRHRFFRKNLADTRRLAFCVNRKAASLPPHSQKMRAGSTHHQACCLHACYPVIREATDALRRPCPKVDNGTACTPGPRRSGTKRNPA